MSWAPVAHPYNPNYSGRRDEEIKVPSQPRQIVEKILSQKVPTPKKGWWRGLQW
jgi:hypothetical protein